MKVASYPSRYAPQIYSMLSFRKGQERFGCNKGCGCDNGCGKHGRCGRGCGCNNGCGNGCAKAAPGCAAPSCAAPACAAPAPTCAAPAPACGCDAPVGKVPAAAGDVAPMPPAPVVDPSAFIPTQRRVVQASNSLVR